jgi:urate oxidase
MKLSGTNYGKERVRLLKILRSGDRDDVIELECSVSLGGASEKAYRSSDNSEIAPSDTLRNVLLCLAHDRLESELEVFGLYVVKHFLDKYANVSSVEVEVVAKPWERLSVMDEKCSHAFVARRFGIPFTRIAGRREGVELESGFKDLRILRTKGASFAGFAKDEFTTLRETSERILCTHMQASWRFASADVDFTVVNEAITNAMLFVFTRHESPSIHRSLYEMGSAALEAAPEVLEISLEIPNIHYLDADLAPFHKTNHGVLFIPLDEPRGIVRATLARPEPASTS